MNGYVTKRLFDTDTGDGERVEGVREFMHSKKAEELQRRLDSTSDE